MGGSGRKRSSKWDLTDDPEFAPGSKQLRSGRSSADVAGSNSSIWSYSEGNDGLKPGRGHSSKESFSGGRDSNKDDIKNRDYRDLDATMDLDTDRSYRKNMSPVFEERKQKRRSQSPKSGWGKSIRSSRSRSPQSPRSGWGRPVRSSVSRSPPHGFRRDSGIYERDRIRDRGSSQPCRDFAAGKCRKGSLCNFVHHDNQNPENSWESKHREDGAPTYSDTHESRDHSFRSGRADEACVNFAKGRCRLGSSCKFVHHNNSDGYGKVSVDELTREKDTDRRRGDSSFEQGGRHGYGKVSVDELTREKEFNRRRGDSSFEQGGRHGPNRSGDIPCKFFANGNCRNGKFCRFSHDRQACRSPDRRLRDDKRASNPGGDHQMFDRPKLSDSISPDDRRLRGDRWGSDGNMTDADKDRDSLKRSVAVSDRAKLVEDKTGNIGATELEFTDWPRKDGWGHSSDKSRVLGEPPFLGDKKEADHWIAENTGANMHTSQSRGADIWSGEAEMSPDWNYRVRPSSHIEEHEQNKHGITQGGTHLATSEHDRVQFAPGQGFNKNAQNVIPLHSSNTHALGQSEVAGPILPSSNPPTQNEHGITQSGAYLATSENDRVQVAPGQGFNQNVHGANPLHSISSKSVAQIQGAVPILPSRGGIVDGANHELFSEKTYTVEPSIMNTGSSQFISRNLPTQNTHGIKQGGTYLATSEHDRVQVAPGQGFNQNAQNVNPLHSSSGHTILPSRGIVDGNHNHEVSTGKMHTAEPSIMDSGLSPDASRNPPTQTMVSNEQIAQLSNLSASLAHILGTGQQLPQLYAALNSHDLKDTPSLAKNEVPSMPVSNTSINPHPVVGLPQQYDPMCDSIEPKADASGVPTAIPPAKRIAEHVAEVPPQLFDSERQSCGDSIKPASLEIIKSDKLNQLQPGQNSDVNKNKNEVAAERRRNSQDAHKSTKEDDGPLDKMDQHAGPDEAKKTKDVKELRAFKFALAEFVKEVLKPTWKEGQMTKEDYKTIVKKVIEKVTGTMQGSQIPQTQEKIDQYLSASKTKLTKLVQAYVEKAKKT